MERGNNVLNLLSPSFTSKGGQSLSMKKGTNNIRIHVRAITDVKHFLQILSKDAKLCIAALAMVALSLPRGSTSLQYC